MKMLIILVFIHLALLCDISTESATETNHLDTNPYFKYYNKLNYDVQDLHEKHLRARRSTDNHVTLSFNGYGKWVSSSASSYLSILLLIVLIRYDYHYHYFRQFDIKLRPKADNFFDHDYIEVLEDDKVKLVPTSDLVLYEGEVTNMPKDSSHVIGTIIDGVFSGTIDLKNEGKYFVETVARYIPADQLDKFDGHSIIYHEEDVNTHEEVKKNKLKSDNENKETETVKLSHGSCGSAKKHVQAQMLEIQKTFAANASSFKNQVSYNEPFYYKYTKEANLKPNTHGRSKRQSINQRFFPNSNLQNTCGMYLKIDPYLYNQIFYREGRQVRRQHDNEPRALYLWYRSLFTDDLFLRALQSRLTI